MVNWSALKNCWLIHKWKTTKAFTEAELAVITCLLADDDARAKLLLRQATDAPKVERVFHGATYDATIPYVKDDRYLIDAEVDLSSPIIRTTDRLSGRVLKFNLTVLRGGFLHGLHGATEDDERWPINWYPNGVSQVGLAWLPASMQPDVRRSILRDLAGWCSVDPELTLRCRDDIVAVKPPGAATDVAAAEKRLETSLPRQYRELVNICNGFSVRQGRPYEVFGTGDAYVLDIPEGAGRSIVVTSLYEEGAVVVVCTGVLAGQTLLVAPGGAPPIRLGDLRTHVRRMLLRLGHDIQK